MASPHDLTSLADLKAWLGVTSPADDAALAALITEVSVAILADLGRAAVRPTVFTEVREGGGARALVLRHWPVAALLGASVDGRALALAGAAPGAGPALALDPPDPAPPGGLQRVWLRGAAFPTGDRTVALTYRAGYEVADEAAGVPLAPPYTVAALAPYGAWCCDGAVSYAGGAALRAGGAVGAGSYGVAGGLYTFAAADAGAAVTLRYGYVPAALGRACREWAGERYAYRTRIGQSSRALGGQETAAFIVKAMPDFVASLLQPYRRVAGP